ncbi:MAG TPA: hypothetical protein VHW23_32430 [Kofleriaceae bacterium]|jgi:hypothetical protein|nr:hypothetical protein [Kofleriaceae bacterium]
MHRLAVIALAAALLGGCSGTRSQAIDAAIDAAIDGTANPCQACSAAQLCVARYDGACLRQVECVARTADCPNNSCSAACQSAYCPLPYQCQDRPSCGGEPAGAFTCYGP